jgi:hypothetical protein
MSGFCGQFPASWECHLIAMFSLLRMLRLMGYITFALATKAQQQVRMKALAK